MKTFSNEQALTILKDLIAIKSVNDHEKVVATYLHDLLAKYGIDSEIRTVHGDRANLVAEIGSGKPVLGVSGHMDVVEAKENNWTSDPFTMIERDGLLFGRGITDMKAGLAAVVITMIELHQQGLPKKGTIRLLTTMGEEIGEDGSKTLFSEGSMDDVDGLIIAEPSGYSIGYAEKGSMDIKFTSKGIASHSSAPDKGFNAIDALMNFLNDANKIFRDKNIGSDTMGPLTFNTTIINGGVQVNSIPALATAEASVRTVPEYDNQKVIATLHNLIEKHNQSGAQISFEVYMNAIPISMDKNNILVLQIKKLMEQYTTEEIKINPIAPATDANYLMRGKTHNFPFIITGPGNDTAHQVNESLEKQMYFNFIDIFETLFVEFLEKSILK